MLSRSRSVRISACGTSLLILMIMTAVATAAPVPSFQPEGSGFQYPDSSHGIRTAVPSIEAHYLGNEKIELDGRLDEAVWDRAQTGWGFQQNEPDRGVPASVPNTFKVLYDDDALYLGMACWEEDASLISSFLSRRDQIESSDLVSIYIDPYHDHTTGYNFRVNPAGVQQDAYVFDNGHRDVDWNAVWESEVYRDEHGWYVEMRIPFAAIRFHPTDNMTWGLQVYRWLHGRGEDIGWVTWDRNLNGFVSRFGTLTGLKNVQNPRKLEITPYFVTSHTNPSTADADADVLDHFQNLGADLKYGLTSNLTLNATIQPDFGQVEADPAVLNLSPFETWYAEKRPFFVEGARSFQHPDFNLFYSRRIGTGDANSRIRGAAKLTGKLAGDVSLAFLGAATDLADEGKVHNPFVTGRHKAFYSLMRIGKEFDEGNHRIGLMGTGVFRDEDSFGDSQRYRDRRDGSTVGADFEMNFDDRNYRLQGAWMGSRVQADAAEFSPYETDEAITGHGGKLEAGKIGGNWRWKGEAAWESDRLDLNDMGFLQAPDEITTEAELGYVYDSDGEDRLFNRANWEFQIHHSMMYAGDSGHEMISPNDTTFTAGAEAWSYDARHRQRTQFSCNAWGQLRNYHQGWIWLAYTLEGSDKWATRRNDLGERGPLMATPESFDFALGGTTDWRKPMSLHLEISGELGERANSVGYSGFLRWNQGEHFTHSIGWGYRYNRIDSQWLDNFVSATSRTGETGIAGVDYVFARMDQHIVDITLRSSVLFNRNQSLQLYLQPYLNWGDYGDPRFLAAPDTYDLRPYTVDASNYDFKQGAVHLNVVYRWEYRPGSTLFLVWTHSNFRRDLREDLGPRQSWDRGFDPGFVVNSEPEDTILMKLSYWFSI